MTLSQNGERERGTNGLSDALVVRTDDLARILEAWIATHEAEHPSPPTMPGALKDAVVSSYGLPERVPVLSGIAFFAEALDIDEANVRRVLNRRTKWTTLHFADDLLSAAGLSHLLRSEIHPVPNPRWSQQHWEAWHAEQGACHD